MPQLWGKKKKSPEEGGEKEGGANNLGSLFSLSYIKLRTHEKIQHQLTVRGQTGHGGGRICLNVQEAPPEHVRQERHVVHHVHVELRGVLRLGHARRHGGRGRSQTDPASHSGSSSSRAAAAAATVHQCATDASRGVVADRLDRSYPVGQEANAVARGRQAGRFEREAFSPAGVRLRLVAERAREVNAFLVLFCFSTGDGRREAVGNEGVGGWLGVKNGEREKAVRCGAVYSMI